eukprot:SAG31_NODE_910_length_11078_cov_25.691062_9_plen_52_part_00
MANIDISQRKRESDLQDEDELAIEAEIRKQLGPDSGRVSKAMMLRFVRGCK